MATLKFLLRSKTENAPIYIRLSLGRNQVFFRKSSLFVNPKDWNTTTQETKQRTSNGKELNSDLRNLKTFLLDKVDEAIKTGENITGVWLDSKIDENFNRVEVTNSDNIVVYGESFIENLKYKSTGNNKHGVSIATQKKYRTIVNKLTAFEKYRKKEILIREVDLNLRNELIKFFSDVQKLNDNTIGRYLKFVKSICIDAQRNGIQVNQQLEHFKGFTIKAPKITLSFDELELIQKANLVNENHIVARDWLIIGCYTGQRVSDLLRMQKSFIQNIQNFEFIVLEQIKTGKLVQIPVHPEVKKILDKREGEFPPIFSKSNDSNKTLFNTHLKKICQISGLTDEVEGNLFDEETERTVLGQHPKYRLVSSHICRRSFATNFYGNPKFPTPLLMNITAHGTEQMFLEYIGKKPIDYGLQLAQIWANEALKKKKTSHLEVVKKLSNN